MKNTLKNLRPLVAFVLFCGFQMQAQLDGFALTVTATDESCTANGTLTFNVSNTVPGATMLYTIYHLPDTTTPVAVLNVNTYTGLVAGDYRVVAVQSLGSQSGSQQQDVTIVSTVVTLQYQINSLPEICGNDGQLFVVPVSGVPVQYEIIAGPVIRPLQSSNTFTDLPGGVYTVRVFDACGEGWVKTHTLISQTPGSLANFFEELTDCETLTVNAYVFNAPQSVIKYPVTVQTTITPPSGPPIVFNHSIPNGSSTTAPFEFTLPFLDSGSYAVHAIVTDGCGNVYENDDEISVPELLIGPQMILPVQGECNKYKLNIPLVDEIGPVMVEFLSAPNGFNPVVHNPNHPGPFNTDSAIMYYNPLVPLPAGTYFVQVTDACGRVATRSVTLTYNTSGTPVFGNVAPGCALGMGSLAITTANGIATAELLSAPAGYPNPLPQNLDGFLSGTSIQMGNLIPGTYQISTVDNCNFPGMVTVNVVGYQRGETAIDIIPHCDSFDLSMTHQDNLPAKTFWLQKLYPSGWAHPITGAAGNPAQINSLNAIPITNDGIYYPVQASGSFRIVKVFSAYGSLDPCQEVIHEFEYSVGPQILKVYNISCGNNLFNTIVDAVGFAPLTYRITMKNGEPFLIENVTSAIFAGLEPAIYNFQVEDGCGNILNSDFEVSQPLMFSVQPLDLCNGESGALAVPAFPFLNYQWWKDNAPGDILSTTNSLAFPSFNATTDAGVYHVSVTSSEEQCIDFVLDFTVSPNLANPQAGNDVSIAYCGPQGTIDLFSLLSGTFDDFGEWEAISGTLSGNFWNSDAADPGQYQFRYTVSGLCDTSDESMLTITLSPAVGTPLASADVQTCESESLQLSASDITGADYSWIGPNGFTSNEQNPIIENAGPQNSGTYTVIASANGCTSDPASVEVLIAPMPEFEISAGCIDNAYVLSATAIESSFDPSLVIYQWSGPDNFSSSSNPVTISGLPGGDYSLTITSPEGCDRSLSVNVPGTLCGIPKGVSPNNDGDNDTWNLSGLDVKHVKIFNRYGMLMYEKANYINEWHGQNKYGGELPSATYYYLVEFNSGKSEAGWVYLLRNL